MLWSEIFELFQSQAGVAGGLVKPSEEMSLVFRDLHQRPNLLKLPESREFLSEVERNGGMIFSTSGRRGNRLPQMHADRISIRDHLMTSTLSQVASYEFEYFRTYLRRTILVMDALVVVSIYSSRVEDGRMLTKNPH